MTSTQARQLFFDYLRFPSISALPAHAADVRACAEWLRNLLFSWGLAVQIHETAGAPVILAKTHRKAGCPTILLYGHYDVQPVEPLDHWLNPPFEPVERDGFIFARGATDNKGQTFSHLIGLKRLLDADELPLNLILLLEGEEEIGSPHFGEFLEVHSDELICDAALVSDTSMIAPQWPALTLGLRGIACFELFLRGPVHDLHSGMFGSAIPNPALALARVLGRLHDANGRIAIPHFYDDVREVSAVELKSWQSLPWNEAWFRQAAGIAPNGGEKDRTLLERIWSRPTAELNGIASGYQGAGSKTIIPSHSSAKLSLRLVPDQHPDHIAELLLSWFEGEFARESLSSHVEYDHGGLPYYTSPDHPFIEAAAGALQSVFGRAPAYTREGLSIPATALLAEKLRIPVILAGLGLPDCCAHAPNESFPISHLELGAQVHVALCNSFSLVKLAR